MKINTTERAIEKWLILTFIGLVSVTGLTFLTSTTAAAATIVVTTTTDEDTEPAIGLGCGLYEAIQSSNSDAAYGGCSAGAGADTITVPAGTYLLNGGPLSRFIMITEQVTIDGGSGARPSIVTDPSDAGTYFSVTVPNVTVRSINFDRTTLSTAWDDGGLATDFTVEQVDMNDSDISTNAERSIFRDIGLTNRSGLNIFGNDALVERVTGDSDTYVEFGGNGQTAHDVTLTNQSYFMSDKTGGSADNIFEDISVDGNDWTGIFITAHGGGDLGRTIVRRASATNNADDGIGLYGVNGGGTFQLVIEDSYIADNQGGGTFSTSPDMTDAVIPSLIVRNTLYENNLEMGGIFHADGYAKIEHTTFYNNDSYGGGAVYAGSRIDIENSTLFGNTASGSNPGDAAYGGAMFFDQDYYNSITANPTASTVTNVTIANNDNPSHASAINVDDYDDGTSARLTTALPVLRNNLIANNTGDQACRAANYDPNNPSALLFAVSFGAGSSNNISSDGSCSGFTQRSSSQLNIDTQLRDMNGLASIGYKASQGYVPVLPLLAESAAINGGTNTYCLAIDQRGQSRPLNGICDVGAYEALAPSTGPELTSTPTAPNSGTPVRLNTEAIIAAAVIAIGSIIPLRALQLRRR